jgi:hypothetical protein
MKELEYVPTVGITNFQRGTKLTDANKISKDPPPRGHDGTKS